MAVPSSPRLGPRKMRFVRAKALSTLGQLFQQLAWNGAEWHPPPNARGPPKFRASEDWLHDYREDFADAVPGTSQDGSV